MKRHCLYLPVLPRDLLPRSRGWKAPQQGLEAVDRENTKMPGRRIFISGNEHKPLILLL
jgi:hypothetical protein